MGSSVGLFLKNGSVQVAHLMGSLRRLKVKQAMLAPLGDGQDALSALLAENKIPRKQVTLALPAHQVIVRKTTLPLTSSSQIQKTIKFHAERIIPGITPDEVVVDYLVTRRGPDFTELLLMAVKASTLAEWGRRCQQVDVTCITVDFVVLFNLLSNCRMFKSADLCVAVDFSGDGVNLLVVHHGRLSFFRALPGLPAAQTAKALQDAIQHALISADALDGLNRIILTGTLPADVTPEAMTAGRPDCEVMHFDPAGHMRFNQKQVKPEALKRMPIASGAALENLGTTALSINLKKEAYQYRSAYEMIRKPCFLMAILLVAGIALQLLSAMHERDNAETYLNSLNAQAKGLFKRVAGGRVKFSGTFDKTLAGLAKKLAGENTGDKTWASFMDFLALFCLHVTGSDEAVIQSVSFDGKKAVIRGEAKSVDSFEQLAKSLEMSGKFTVRSPFRIRSGRRNQPARLAFTIELSPRRPS